MSFQIAICFGIVSVQLTGSLVRLAIDLPGTDVLFPSWKETILTCKDRAYRYCTTCFSSSLVHCMPSKEEKFQKILRIQD